jgi:hypothetical protein
MDDLIIYDEFDQQSPEWETLRLGSIGGSRIGTVASKGTGRQTLLYSMAGEIISCKKKETYSNQYMVDGINFEDDARQYYSVIAGNEVRQVALIKDGEHKHVSPDGLVGGTGMIEIKNVIPSTFIAYASTGSIDTGYRRQMQWGLKRSRRQWCDYILYCKDFEGKCDPMIVTRVDRDEKEIRFLEESADLFIGEMKAIVEKIRKR